MNQVHTMTSINIIGKAKSIFINLAFIAAALLVVSSAFAEGCPLGSSISEKFRGKVKSGQDCRWYGGWPDGVYDCKDIYDTNVFVRDGSNSSWKLTWPNGAKPNDLAGKKLEVKSVTFTKMNPELKHKDKTVKDLTCNYGFEHDAHVYYTLTISARALLTTNSYIYEHVDLKTPGLWEYVPATNTERCPSLDPKRRGTMADCKFDEANQFYDPFKKAVETNGYWQDAVYRCGHYCGHEKAQMAELAKRTQLSGCKQLTCSDEINEMNGYVKSIASARSNANLDSWWVCWSTNSDRHWKGNPLGVDWQTERHPLRTTEEEKNGLPSKWGQVLHGTRLWPIDKDLRSQACYGPPIADAWPEYKALGIKF